MWGFRIHILWIWLAAIVMSAVPANAQTISPSNIFKRSDNAEGIVFAGFKLFPKLALRETYDDNIFRTRDDAKSDFITNYHPSLVLQSNWDRHSLLFAGEGDFGVYRDNAGQDYSDYTLLASGQYDLIQDVFLTGAVSQSRKHQGRDFLEDAEDDGSLASYKVTSEIVGFTHDLRRLKFRVFAQNSNMKLEDDADNLLIDDFIKRNTQSLESELKFEFTPGNSIFLSNIADTSDYKFSDASDLNSKGMNWKLGLNYDGGGIWSGKVFVGYLSREYDDKSKDTQKPYFGTFLQFRPSKLTSLSFTYDKNFTETTIANAAGIVRTTHKIDMRHSITQFLTGTATIGYDDNDYVGGSDDDRQTKFTYLGFGGDYQFSDQLAMRLSYDYRERESNRPLDEYDNNRVMLSLTYSH